MKPENNKKSGVYKRKVSDTYGFGVAKIVAGIPMAALGLMFITAGLYAPRLSFYTDMHFNIKIAYYVFETVAVIFALCGSLLIYSGIDTCRLVGAYRRITKWMSFRNRESLHILSNVTKQTLTGLVNDLDKMIDKRFWPQGYVDLERAEFAAQTDGAPAPLLKDGDTVLREKTKIPRKTLIVFPAVLIVYAIFRPYPTWYDFAVAGAISLVMFILVAAKTPRLRVISEKKYTAPPAPEPVPINTGNLPLDELLNTATGYIGELNTLSLSLTSEKMVAPVSELLNISRQIFSFVEKHPEKVRQIRQFMNYYLPTTIKLLQSYRDFAAEPLKGDNITSAMTKIEESMDGIVETFRRELDNLYSDKATDITVEVDVMLSMMRGKDFTDSFMKSRTGADNVED